MIRVSITTLGCKVNSYESDAMAGLLRSRGFEIVPEDEPADIAVVNTCTVTNIADRKSRQMISRCRKLSPDVRIIVTGCWSQRNPEEASRLEGVCAVLGSSEKSRIADVCFDIINGQSGKNLVRDLMHEHEFEELSSSAEGRTRAYLKIQDGCNRFCTYCAIPFARGGIRSRSLESIRRELDKMNEQGFREVVLTGIHLTDYGKDLNEYRLSDVIKCFREFDCIDRVRFGSLEPHGIDDELIDCIANEPKVCRQFHLSLQSGSTSVLERMRRGYTADEYAEIVEKIRNAYGADGERVAFTTDIIAGFPGETEQEHRETMDFMKRIRFARVHVFPYSRRSGTIADRMPCQLTNAQKAERAGKLIGLGHELERSFLGLFFGRKEKVLIESKRSDGLLFGYSDQYVRVLTSIGEPNTLVDVKIKNVMEDKNGELSLLSDSVGRNTVK